MKQIGLSRCIVTIHYSEAKQSCIFINLHHLAIFGKLVIRCLKTECHFILEGTKVLYFDFLYHNSSFYYCKYTIKTIYNIFLYYYENIDGYCTDINITNLIEHFILDICFVVDNAILIAKDTEILNNFETVVFENGQGLALSCYSSDYAEYSPQKFYLTSTNTGAIISYRIIERNFCRANVEICYVTRTYLTRHGDGNFIEYNSDNPIFLFDYTNIYNPFQGKLRYSNFIPTLILNMLGRIRNDFYQNTITSNKNNYICSILVTHWNEKPEIHEKLASEIIQQMDYLKRNKYNGNFYISDSKYRDSVRIYNKEELEKENK